MEIIISLIMGTRLLTLFGGGLEHEAARVTFLPPGIMVMQGEVRADCFLANAYPEQLKKLAGTGTPVVIYLFVELREDGKRQGVNKMTVENRLQYDLITRMYTVIRNAKPDTLRTASLDSAIVFSSTFRNVPVARKSELSADAEYSIAAYAVLGKTMVEALNNKEVDLMYYWDFKRPNFRTEPMRGRAFLEK